MVHLASTRERPHRRSWASSIAVFAALMCIAALLSACDSAHASDPRIDILPSSNRHGTTWQYNAACTIAPVTASGCAPAGPNMKNGQLTGDLWNLGTAAGSTGSVRMSFDGSGKLHLRSTLSDAPPCTASTCIASQANTWVRGFPSVLYGIDQCHGSTAPPDSSALKLPARMTTLPSGVVGDTTYDTETASVTDDVAYDMWLNPSNTKNPCRIDGTLEVMVWTRYDAQALVPDSLKIGTMTMPYSINGTTYPGTQAWSVYANNVFHDNHTQPWGGVVWLVIDAAHSIDRGNVKVDLAQALSQVATLLQSRYGWTNVRSTYWLDTIQFGVEFGLPNANVYGSGPTPFSLDLTSYCLHLDTTVAAAGHC